MFSDISSPIRYCKVNFSALSQIFIFIFNPEFPPEPRRGDPGVLTALCFTEAFINGVMPWKIKGFLLSWSAKSSYTSLWLFVLECGHHFWKTNIHSNLQVRKKIKEPDRFPRISSGTPTLKGQHQNAQLAHFAQHCSAFLRSSAGKIKNSSETCFFPSFC